LLLGPPPTYELVQFSSCDASLLVLWLLFLEVCRYGEIGVSFCVVAVDAVELLVHLVAVLMRDRYLITVCGSP
jgi:hypothetical protein